MAIVGGARRSRSPRRRRCSARAGDMMAIASAARREREAHPRTLRRSAFFARIRALRRAFRTGSPPTNSGPAPATPATSAAGIRRGSTPTSRSRRIPRTGRACSVTWASTRSMAIPLAEHRSSTGGVASATVPAGRLRRAEASRDWRPMAWPQLARTPPGSAPPPIPHDLQFRGNCLACHAGPAAVAEIRTTHPERADCRQCHVSPDPGGDSARTAGRGERHRRRA